MRCLSEDQFDAFLDGGATPEMERHLLECDACRAELEALRSLCRALDDLEPERPPRDLAPLVMTQVRSSPPSLLIRAAEMAWLGSVTLAGFLTAGFVREWVRAATMSLAGSLGAFPALLRLARAMITDARTTLWVMFRIPQAGMACVAFALAAAGLGLVVTGLRRHSRIQGKYEEEIA